VSSISCEGLGHEVDLLDQARCGPVDWPADGRFVIRCDAGSATFADGSEQGRRIVCTEVTTVAHGLILVSFFGKGLTREDVSRILLA
jgi:hypothetical protein